MSTLNRLKYEFDLMKDLPKSISSYFVQCLKQVVKEDFLISIESVKAVTLRISCTGNK